MAGSGNPRMAYYLYKGGIMVHTKAAFRLKRLEINFNVFALIAVFGLFFTVNVPFTAASPVSTSGIPMVRIPSGSFLMGSSVDEPGRQANEGPQWQVTLDSFYMGRYLVTQEQWVAVMGTNPSHFTGNINRPVENVSWYDTIVFSNKLSFMAGLSPAYEIRCAVNDEWTTNPDRWGTVPTNSDIRWNNVRIVPGSTGYRLPTEAQWEYAARAGSTTLFNFGNRITSEYANFGNNHRETTLVGSFPPNAWGLYDMHGNLVEWVWDWMGPYPSIAQNDPIGPIAGTIRVLRGGSWNLSAQFLRSAQRFGNDPSDGWFNDGFRLVRP